MGVFSAAMDLAPCCANDNQTIAAFLLDVRGQAAALAGVALSANPYRAGSFEACCWSTGWLAGKQEIAGTFPVQQRRARPLAVAMEPLTG